MRKELESTCLLSVETAVSSKTIIASFRSREIKRYYRKPSELDPHLANRYRSEVSKRIIKRGASTSKTNKHQARAMNKESPATIE